MRGIPRDKDGPKLRDSSSGVPRGAEGAIRPGRHSEGGGKKGKKEKRKKRKKEKGRKKEKKREKENMGEACNYSKTKLEHLSCGAPMHV